MNKNQHRGFVAHKRGIDFEAEVERTNSDLFLEGIGRVYKGHVSYPSLNDVVQTTAYQIKV